MKNSDAKLRFLGHTPKKHLKIAVFELPPHQRTIFFYDYPSGPYSTKQLLVHFPHLIFVIPFVERYHRVTLDKPVGIDPLTSVQLYFTQTPLQEKNANTLYYVCNRNVCFGYVPEIYTPEKNIYQLFLKIADLYFSTSFDRISPFHNAVINWDICRLNWLPPECLLGDYPIDDFMQINWEFLK